MMKILIVEDESLVALDLAETVRSYGFEVTGICADGAQAVRQAGMSHPDVILMDIRLQGERDGVETAEQICNHYRPLLIFLTAFSDTPHIERATALQPLGYLIKPVNPRELFALLTMADTRRSASAVGDIVLDDDFSYDTAGSQLIRRGTFVKLTRREQQLLFLLMRSKNRVVSIYEVENTIWPDKAPNENTRRSLVNRLRAKLNNRFIETLPSVGYRMTI
jgi:DNA-binding response OmpR family regulator